MRRTPLLRLATPLLAVVLLAACELSVALDVDVDRAGGGTVDLHLVLDDELLRILEDASVDPLRDLDVVTTRDGLWSIETEEPEGGGLAVRLSAPFDDPDGFEALLADLHRGLDEHDPRISEQLRLQVRDGGAVALEGRVGLIPPTSPGVRGEGVGFDDDALARLVEERGDEFARYDVRVTLPAAPEEHDGDAVDGTSITWNAPIGELRDVSAVSERPGPPWVIVIAAVALVAAVAAFIGGIVWRRRRDPTG